MSNEFTNSAHGAQRRADEDETKSFLNKLKDIATEQKSWKAGALINQAKRTNETHYKLTVHSDDTTVNIEHGSETLTNFEREFLISEVQRWLGDSELGSPERLKHIVSKLSELADRWDKDNRVQAGLAKLEPYITAHNENLMALSLLNPRYPDGRVASQNDLRSLAEDSNSDLWRRLTKDQQQAALELNKSHNVLESASNEQRSIEEAVAKERLLQLESLLKEQLPKLASVRFALEDYPPHTMGQYDPADHAITLGIKDLSRSPIDRYRVLDASIHELSHALINQRIAQLASALAGASNPTSDDDGLTVEKFPPDSAEWIDRTSKLYRELSGSLGSSNFEFVHSTYDLGNLAPNYPIGEVFRDIKYRLRDERSDSMEKVKEEKVFIEKSHVVGCCIYS